MTTVYIGLGSNLGNSQAIVQSAFTELAALTRSKLLNKSACYQSVPLGDVSQPAYINAVASLETELTAEQLLDKLFSIEKKYGRDRSREQRWGARLLDLDLLLYGDENIITERLTTPHPELQNRDFVLYPLFEIAPELEIPRLGKISSLLEQCDNRGLNIIN